MKKILYTDFSSGFGGSSNILYDFLKNLDRTTIEPVVLAARVKAPNFKKIQALGIKVIEAELNPIGTEVRDGHNSYISLILDLVQFLGPNVSKITQIIKREKIDLVHINNSVRNSCDVILACKLVGVPSICHMRENRKAGKLEKLFVRMTDCVLVRNQFILNDINLVRQDKRARLMREAIDLDISVTARDIYKIKQEFALSNISCVGFLGRLVEGKGVEDFIQAAVIVKQSFPNTKFMVIGSDPQKEHYEDFLKILSHRLGVHKDFIWTGWRSDKFNLISVMDLLVQTSYSSEGFGLTCMEAMALGKPVIATEMCEPLEIVINGENGLIVPSQNPKALADAMIKLLADPKLAQMYGRRGRQMVEERFNIKEQAHKMSGIYQELLK
jgi:glycosyltransferase involved in cell wall biosynthesis